MTKYTIGAHTYEVQTSSSSDRLQQRLIVDGEPAGISLAVSEERLAEIPLEDLIGLFLEGALARIEWIESQD